jgi:hypothetical protein
MAVKDTSGIGIAKYASILRSGIFITDSMKVSNDAMGLKQMSILGEKGEIPASLEGTEQAGFGGL